MQSLGFDEASDGKVGSLKTEFDDRNL